MKALARQKITPFLWFDHQAEDAARFYVSLFARSKILSVSGKGPNGGPMAVSFVLDGQPLHALNGGPIFTFTAAISLYVDCQTQAEVDTLWTALSRGGSKGRCGWLKDRYGLSWQLVPSVLGRLINDPDAEKAQRAMAAMMKMRKLDIKKLQAAHAGR